MRQTISTRRPIEIYLTVLLSNTLLTIEDSRPLYSHDRMSYSCQFYNLTPITSEYIGANEPAGLLSKNLWMNSCDARNHEWVVIFTGFMSDCYCPWDFIIIASKYLIIVWSDAFFLLLKSLMIYLRSISIIILNLRSCLSSESDQSFSRPFIILMILYSSINIQKEIKNKDKNLSY